MAASRAVSCCAILWWWVLAHNRYLKPEFFKDEDLAALPPIVRLCYAGLWTQADCEGRFEWKPRRLAIEIFPYDPKVDFAALLDLLEKHKFIARYSASDRVYGHIPTWHRHQSPYRDEPPSELPPPPHCDEAVVRSLPPNATVRSRVYARDGYHCQYCGRNVAQDGRSRSVDCVVPLARGGSYDEMNLVTACKACTARKANRTPTEAGMSWPAGYGVTALGGDETPDMQDPVSENSDLGLTAPESESPSIRGSDTQHSPMLPQLVATLPQLDPNTVATLPQHDPNIGLCPIQERGSGNEDRGTRIGERGTRNEERGTGEGRASGAAPPQNEESEKPIEPLDLCKLWNAAVESLPNMPKANGVGGNRANAAKARIAEHPKRSWWRGYFARIMASDFLSGRKPGKDHPGWRATFDWALSPSNLAKVESGNFDNRSALVDSKLEGSVKFLNTMLGGSAPEIGAGLRK